MKGKASDICPKCKYCEGMVKDSFYVCGDSHSDGGLYHLMPAEDELYCTAYEEETNMKKIEGKASDWCPKCKNCKAVTRMHDVNEVIRIMEVDCEDPYDDMTKTLYADSDICCSMFEPKPPCEKCERFDGIYCHSPKGITTPSCTVSFGKPGNCPSYEEKKEPHGTKTAHEIELEVRITALFSEKSRMEETLAELNRTIYHLEKEKAAHMKGIERLKKSQKKLQNQVKNLQTTNEESYKREQKLEDKCRKLERRLLDENKKFSRINDEFLIPLSRVLYPGEKVCKPYSEILKDIKEFRLEKTIKTSDYEIEIKSLLAKYKAIMSGWNDTIELYDNLKKEKRVLQKTERNS